MGRRGKILCPGERECETRMARDHTATQPCEPITLTLEAITSCASVGGGESAAPGAGSMTAARGSRNTWGSKVKTRGERRVRHTCHTSHLTRHTSHVTRHTKGVYLALGGQRGKCQKARCGERELDVEENGAKKELPEGRRRGGRPKQDLKGGVVRATQLTRDT